MIGFFVIVDDLGLVVDVLGGEFGIYLVCYVGVDVIDDINIDKLLVFFDGEIYCKVYFFCILVFMCYVDDFVLLVS